MLIMKSIIQVLTVLCFSVFFIIACKKNVSNSLPSEISIDVLAKIKAQGFSINNVRKVDRGYVVEGDIFLAEATITSNAIASPTLRIANSEQYRTNNLITGLPRMVSVSITGFPSSVYTDAADIAIARYNTQSLRISFQRVADNGNIGIVNDNTLGSGVLGQSAGFPSSAGDLPSDPIRLSSNTIGDNPDVNFVATIIAHEIGHDIGLRHTDYFNRAYSCGGTAVNEGDAGFGAINIPGTPTDVDPNSWMLACVDPGINRPFNNNDIIALNRLYGPPPPTPRINGNNTFYFSASVTAGSGNIIAIPGTVVTVTVSAGGPPNGSYSTSIDISGASFSNGGTYLATSGSGGSSASNTFTMPSSGSINWTGNFSEPNSYGSGAIQVQ